MIDYSIGLVSGYSFAKALTPAAPRLKTKNYHIHHWMWASALLITIYFSNIESEILTGVFTGVALQGLSYKNWSLWRKKEEDK